MRILVTGSNGLLGQKIVRQLKKRKIEFLATSKGKNRNLDCEDLKYVSMDICSEEEIAQVFNSFLPTHVVHTAAMTNVDACELNPEDCYETNVLASKKLFNEAKKIGAHFQLLSTDFIFDGEKGNYKEDDKPNPLSIYAKSKVDAEQFLITDSYSNFSIVRTIIVYGIGNNLSRTNIVCWAKDALSKGQEMKIIDDQFRAPTWADDLAWACIRICELNKKGVYHISGPETMSIFNVVERVARHFGLSTETLVRTDSSTLNQPAKRPTKTGFNLTKARNELGYNPKTLEETLDFI
ncbi:MAG: SDR family oxidoreductase [Bacteroidetes bacterium]|nr:SDR family oxidoreductase [Bacteroidota bacterium]